MAGLAQASAAPSKYRFGRIAKVHETVAVPAMAWPAKVDVIT